MLYISILVSKLMYTYNFIPIPHPDPFVPLSYSDAPPPLTRLDYSNGKFFSQVEVPLTSINNIYSVLHT